MAHANIAPCELFHRGGVKELHGSTEFVAEVGMSGVVLPAVHFELKSQITKIKSRTFGSYCRSFRTSDDIFFMMKYYIPALL